MSPDSHRLVRALAALSAAFPRQPISPETVQVYARSLADIPVDSLERAVDRLLATSRFFPAIAEIRAEVSRETLDGMPVPELAWDEVMRELRRVGHTGPPIFSCPEIHQAVRAIGGWGYLCLAATNAPDRAKFVDAYRAARDQASRRAQLGERLAGQLPTPVQGLIDGVTAALSSHASAARPPQGAPRLGSGDGRSPRANEPGTSEVTDGET